MAVSGPKSPRPTPPLDPHTPPAGRTPPSPSSARRRVGWTVAALLLVGAALALWPGGPQPTRQRLIGQPTLGSSTAAVQIVLFEDFKCPACQRFDAEVLPELERTLIQSRQAQLSFVNFPFLGPDSHTAAQAAECVFGQDPALFWPYAHLLYRAQGDEALNWATPERLLEVASYVQPAGAGSAVNPGELRSCLETQATAAAVKRDLELARSWGVNSTPSVFVGGQRVINPTAAAIIGAVRQAGL